MTDKNDELLALESIYEVNVSNEAVQLECNGQTFLLKFDLPLDYPNVLPRYSLKFPTLYLKDTQLQWERRVLLKCEELLNSLFVPGEPVLFTFIEELRELLNNEQLPLSEITEPVLESNLLGEQAPEWEIDQDGFAIIPGTPKIYHSSAPLQEKKSVFVAHVARVYSLKEVKLVRKTLLTNKHVAKATHNIGAYRIVEDNGVVRQDGDDDGETAAGARLLHLLQLAECQNVYVVVSRWYGGIQLGPSRFKCINNCARQLLIEQNILLSKE
jgi:hypothetical protein